MHSSLLGGAALLAAARLLLALAATPLALWATLLLVLPVGESLAVPVLTAAIKQHCTAADRPAAYGLFYMTVRAAATKYCSAPLLQQQLQCHEILQRTAAVSALLL